MFKTSLEQINRGRTGQNYFKKTPEFVKKITDKIPQDIKGLLKKFSGNKINTSINMYPVNTKLKMLTLVEILYFLIQIIQT